MIKFRGIILVMGFISLFFFRGNAQTLPLREICDINYQTDYTSIADRSPEDLFPKGQTVGFVHFYRGISLLRQRSYLESIYDFKSALNDTTVSRSLCNLYLGIAFMQLNQPDSIFTMYGQAMKVAVEELKKPEFWDNIPYVQENTFAAYLLATDHALHHPNDTLLIESLFKYATKDPKFYDAFYNYGTYNYFLSRFGNAINLLLKARELNQKDDAILLLCMGYLYRLVGDNSQSLKTYDLLISKNPDHAYAYNNKACVEAYIEKYNPSVKNLSRAVSKNRRLTESWFNRGIIYLKLEKFQNAIADLTLAIQLKPDFGDAYYFRGFAKKTSGDLAGSVSDFTRALELKQR